MNIFQSLLHKFQYLIVSLFAGLHYVCVSNVSLSKLAVYNFLSFHMLVALPIQFVMLKLAAVSYRRSARVCLHIEPYAIQMIIIFEFFRG